MTSSYIYDAIRTPFGRYGRGLSKVRPDDLAADVLVALLRRHSNLDPALIDDVIMGDANQAGEDNRDVARMAVLLAGLPTTVTGSTVNRLCGSGMDAIIQSCRAVEAGDFQLAIAGGVESMTRAPFVMSKPESAYPSTPMTLHSSSLGWRLVNERMPSQWTVSLGETAELLADEFDIARDEQDAYAVSSHHKAAAAWAAGRMKHEVIEEPYLDMVADEGIRPEASLQSLASLQPVFRAHGTVTAGNSSPLSDGSAVAIIGSETVALNIEPLARVVSKAAAGGDPRRFGVLPVEAAERALARAGLGWNDIDLIELNEAFASQAIACLRLLPQVDPDIVNIDGGAIAIGHPLGASGARIVGHAAHALKARGSGRALIAICIGVGQALAMILER